MTTQRVFFGVLVTYAVFLALAGIAAWCAKKVLHDPLWSRNGFALVAPFLFPVFISAWGVLFWWHGAEDTEPAWRLQAFRCVCLLYPISCVYSVWRSRGYRWFAAALIPLSFLISLFAAGWAAACVTGD